MISKNHLVNNMVEAFLKLNPEKARSDEDKTELDKKNEIKGNMKHPGRTENFSDDDEGDDDDDASDSNSDTDEPFITIGPSGNQVRVPITVCRLCPAYRGRIEHPVSVIPLGE